MDASFLFEWVPLQTQPGTDPVISISVRFQADNSLRTNYRLMDYARRQVESVTGFEGDFLFEFGQTKRDRAAHNIDDFVIGMHMCGIDIVRSVGPGVWIQTFIGAELSQRGFGR
jgi:hypothetical protein